MCPINDSGKVLVPTRLKQRYIALLEALKLEGTLQEKLSASQLATLKTCSACDINCGHLISCNLTLWDACKSGDRDEASEFNNQFKLNFILVTTDISYSIPSTTIFSQYYITHIAFKRITVDHLLTFIH